MSGFEILTITFSFIVGLGMAQVLRSVGHVIRERDRISLHWIPFSAAVLILFFQIQFWFGLAVINSLLEQWAWPVYSLVLSLAVLIFLAGATVLPPPGTGVDHDLREDFRRRGRVSLLFLAVYLLGWIGVGIMFWRPEFWWLVGVNGLMALLLVLAYQARRGEFALHVALLALTAFGSVTVWTTPNLQMPLMSW